MSFEDFSFVEIGFDLRGGGGGGGGGGGNNASEIEGSYCLYDPG